MAKREEEMRALLRRWQRSGLPLYRFADREGVCRKTLYRWRARLAGGGDQRRPAKRRAARPQPVGVGRPRQPVPFTEVSAALREAASAGAMYEVVLGRETTVRVPAGFEPGALRTLLETLRAC